MTTNLDVLEGFLTSFNLAKSCGTITVRTENGRVESFFFHSNKTVFSEVPINEISIGMWARFRMSEAPAKAGQFRHAIDVELYTDPALIAAQETLAGNSGSAQ